MSLEKDIRDLAEGLLEDDTHFLVDVDLSLSGSKSKIKILLDGDKGVTIDACAKLSRALGNQLEEDDTMPGAYTLEVSSPGIDHPLSSPRQFRKNIGRQLKVSMAEGKDKKGTLTVVDETSITMEVTTGKGKDKTQESLLIPYKDIEKAIVQISFK